jgi:N-acetylglutamate synthase-like GNAT family acetyltransferase
MNTIITTASKSDKKSLMRFYKQQSYSASLLGYDNTYMMNYSGEIIGAVIISALKENNPQLFLHALVIKKEFRQKRLASELIKHALFQHATQQIVCFADESLTHFYQLNNFCQITEHQLLEPLLRRYLSYSRSLPSMALRHTVHPEHRRSLPSMTPRHTVHPEHRRSLPSMALRHTVHPEHRRSLPSMAPRHTVHPEHRRSLPSMAPRHTVHPEHKKTNNELLVFSRTI